MFKLNRLYQKLTVNVLIRKKYNFFVRIFIFPQKDKNQ
jgi:hypothetical protein